MTSLVLNDRALIPILETCLRLKILLSNPHPECQNSPDSLTEYTCNLQTKNCNNLACNIALQIKSHVLNIPKQRT